MAIKKKVNVKVGSIHKKIMKKFLPAPKTRKLKIKLSGKDSKGKSTTITIPVNPEKITYKSAGRFQEYDIINKGTAKVPNGKEISSVGWESFFPGATLKKQPYVIKYTDPHKLRNQLEYWRKSGKQVKVTISTTPINFSTYLESYEESYEGSNGNIYYTIEFSQAIDISVETVKKKKGKTTGKKRASKRSGAKSYTVKNGDCLWNISKKFYGKGKQWQKIYNANKDKIEKAAKRHGKKNSCHGWWIYPGTKLKIP